MRRKQNLVFQLMSFYTAFQVVNMLGWLYYPIFLYKKTGSIDVIVQDNLFFYTGIFIGILLFSILIDRWGYLKSFRISFLFQAFSALLVFFLHEYIADIFAVMALINGLAQGTFWPIYHLITLKEIKKRRRNSLLNEIHGVGLIISLVVPFFAGFLLTKNGRYDLLFLTSSGVYMFMAFLPLGKNKLSQSKISVKEITAILRKPGFKSYFFLNIYHLVVFTIQHVLYKILPFIIIGSELGVGALISGIAIISALLSFFSKGWTPQKKFKPGLLSYISYSFAEFGVAAIFTTPMLLIREITFSFVRGFGLPSRDYADYRIREGILQKDMDESAVEMNLIVEATYFLGRLIGLGVLFLIYTIVQVDQIVITQLMLALLSFSGLVVYQLNNHLMQKTDQIAS